MNNKVLVSVLCVVLTMLMAATLTACGDDTPVVVEPVGDLGHDPNTVIVMTTNPNTVDILDFTDIIAINSADLKWSSIEGYRHTDGDNNTATFDVICTDNKTGTLQVAYDPASGAVTQADFSYGEKTVSILTDDNAVLMEILAEINKE